MSFGFGFGDDFKNAVGEIFGSRCQFRLVHDFKNFGKVAVRMPMMSMRFVVVMLVIFVIFVIRFFVVLCMVRVFSVNENLKIQSGNAIGIFPFKSVMQTQAV